MRTAIACALAGALAGLASGLTGLGGGTLLIPMLTALAGLPQHAAHGTSLAVLAASSVASAATYLSRGAADITLALIIGLVGTLTARSGARLCARIRARDLRWLLGWYLYASAIAVLARPLLTGGAGLLHPHATAALAGTASGLAAGLFGLGGGTIVVPALTLLAGLPQKTAQGTSLAAALPIAVSGALAHARLNHVHLPALLGAAPAALAGAWAGATLATGLAPDTLRHCYAGFLILIALKYALEV